MAMKRVDVDDDDEINSYGFVDDDGVEIFVRIPDDCEVVDIVAVGMQQNIQVYKKDILLLIKALEASYNHKAP